MDERALGVASQIAENALIGFLQADLDLSFTMLQSAALTSDPEIVRNTLDKARSAVLVIRQLQGRIRNPKASKIIRDRADELERELSALSPPES